MGSIQSIAKPLIASFVIILVLPFSGFPQITFERTYGEWAGDWGYSVQQTSDGGYIIAGYHSSGGTGWDLDVYLIKTDSLGDTLWTRTYGGLDHDIGFCVQQTVDGGYIIVGAYDYDLEEGLTGDVYLIKTDSLGDTLWTRTYSRSPDGDYGYSIRQTKDGGYIIAGETWSFDSGTSRDIYLIKTDVSGDTLWTKIYGTVEQDWCGDVQLASDGGYIIVGCSGGVYLVKTDSLGNTLWTRNYCIMGWDKGNSAQQTKDGGYIIAGVARFMDEWDYIHYYIFLLKTDSLGDTLWTKTYGKTGWDEGNSVQQTADGGYIITGVTGCSTGGSADVYLIKTDSLGDTLWTRTYGGTDYSDEGNCVQQTTDGGYIITGGSCIDINGEVYLIKTDSQGRVGIKGLSDHIFPKEFYLSQNYPNPFNPITEIKYALPKGYFVRLEIYNILGQKVASLVDGKQKAGYKTVRWDARSFSSGIYFYRLKAIGDRLKVEKTRKMVLLR